MTSISNNSEVNISQPFSLQCIATGFPPPILSWSKNGANVPYGPSIFSVNLTTTQLPNSLPQVGSALNFTSLQRNDTANYTCVAMNTILTTLNDSQTSQLVILGECVVSVLSRTSCTKNEYITKSCKESSVQRLFIRFHGHLHLNRVTRPSY